MKQQNKLIFMYNVYGKNNANHIHTVTRDLKNDFGGDEMLRHFKNDQH